MVLTCGEGGESRTHVRKHIHPAFSERIRLIEFRKAGRLPANSVLFYPVAPPRTGRSGVVYLHNRRRLICLQVNRTDARAATLGRCAEQTKLLLLRICYFF